MSAEKWLLPPSPVPCTTVTCRWSKLLRNVGNYESICRNIPKGLDLHQRRWQY